MAIDDKKIKLDTHALKYIGIIDRHKKGFQAELARAIGKESSFFSELRRGKPVNLNHLRAMGIVCGPQEILEILSIDKSERKTETDELVQQARYVLQARHPGITPLLKENINRLHGLLLAEVMPIKKTAKRN